jgi:hypothetical protein
MTQSSFIRPNRVRRGALILGKAVYKPGRLGGLEVDNIVVNGLTEQAPDVL